ncbi:hypothetical protein V5F32_00670 [Xanthobacter oligotrophicus]|uniref:Uncharacterized protein n=1 Tax=Xanthobacter oligotrophicus TaxID=2607286 RepID=A0ABW6ZPL3_9HYPH
MTTAPRGEPADRPTGARRIPSRQLPWLAPGFCIWFSALVFVYVLHSMGCAFGWSAATIRLSLSLALIVHLALIGVLWRLQARRGSNPAFGRAGTFLHWIIVGTLVSALVKIVFTLGPILFLTACT